MEWRTYHVESQCIKNVVCCFCRLGSPTKSKTSKRCSLNIWSNTRPCGNLSDQIQGGEFLCTNILKVWFTNSFHLIVLGTKMTAVIKRLYFGKTTSTHNNDFFFFQITNNCAHSQKGLFILDFITKAAGLKLVWCILKTLTHSQNEHD